ncbi:Bile acid 7-alpha-dehydratase [Flavobacterium sp. 9AF]|uniref:nuclear transport factor 2 family protein n=1 Tax=Flavobacterium sp. 9AF TaxID=2653142 RepID=UPI0012F04541|nr:nuclear transport factor 2 family protein [Flavobacterium sp. 9AF]VXC04916.1 Bile acid 7-alpha-dehydratase [Flavobacterium sp. 9AF]
MQTSELEDKVLIRELTDNLSILGDKKDFANQVKLFTEDAVSETIVEGLTILKLQGRQAMIEAFETFLKEFQNVYHLNGQQVIDVKGNIATGTCYCHITLISTENGVKMKTSIGAIYKDNYIKENNRWLVSKRIGVFEWQDKNIISK